MVQHLFKLLWKKRKSNFLIMLEIFVAFIILFAVSSLSLYFYKNYVQASGIKIENVWAVHVNYNSHEDSLNRINGEILHQKLKSFKEIETISFESGMFPYGNSSSGTGFEVNGKHINSRVLNVDETYPSVLGLELVAGKWFKYSDTIQKDKYIVINQKLKEDIFGNADAIGKTLNSDGDDVKERIIGVVGNLKIDSDFEVPEYLIIKPYYGIKNSFLVKMTPSVSTEFEAQFAKSLRQLGKNWSIEIQHEDEMKANKNSIIIIPLTIAFIVCGFLIINVAFGLFGVLFQNIQRRRGEIGIRRAMGASGNAITSQFVGEMVVLATFAIALGVFFAVQFPILKVFDVASSVYFGGIGAAILAVYLLVILCAWFPSRQAAAIHPAMALHDE